MRFSKYKIKLPKETDKWGMCQRWNDLSSWWICKYLHACKTYVYETGLPPCKHIWSTHKWQFNMLLSRRFNNFCLNSVVVKLIENLAKKYICSEWRRWMEICMKYLIFNTIKFLSKSRIYHRKKKLLFIILKISKDFHRIYFLRKKFTKKYK